MDAGIPPIADPHADCRAEQPGRRRFLNRSLLAGATVLTLGRDPGIARAQPSGGTPSRLGSGAPSATAAGAALARAVHQIADTPRVFDDPFALPILGPVTGRDLQAAIDRQSRALRASIVLRSRYAEDRLDAAVGRGVRQYVVLGAGLDTYALRNPHAAAGLRVFEVDHPATQRFKRERLDRAGMATAPGTTFVPIDFETETLRQALTAAGFRFDRPAFFSMLGVVIYLTDAAVMDTLALVAGCAPGSEIAFSFSVPDELLTEAQRASRTRAMAVLAASGEPWINFYRPDRLAASLRALGFASAMPLSPDDANRTYFPGRSDGLRIATGYMMSAKV